MATQKTSDTIAGVQVKLTTEGPEAQEGHTPGSDVLHMKLKKAISEVAESYD